LNLLLATAPAEVPRGDLPAALPRSPYSQRGEEEKLVHALSESVRLSNLRYRGGLDSYAGAVAAGGTAIGGSAVSRTGRRLAIAL
jgi:hypothetical protein